MKKIDVVHQITCRHQVEIEVWPPRAEATYRDDRGANPATTLVRFEATVYNACFGGVSWEVLDVAGNPGAGTIDATGLYRAPVKGALPSGHTDVVIATSLEDPLRKAYAWVTLVGVGPEAKPVPLIQIHPKTAYLYYPDNVDGNARNEFIDASNKMQVFRATLRNSSTAGVEWLVDGALQANPAPASLFHYKVTGAGNTKVVVVTARITATPSVRDDAKVVLINYRWPKMKPVNQL